MPVRRPEPEPTRKRLQERFGWIGASLRYTGQFAGSEKKAFREVFGLAESMVSRDQDRFCDEFAAQRSPGLIVKAKGRLKWAPDLGPPAEPVFPLPSMHRWLADTLGSRFEDIPPIGRAEPAHRILRPILEGIGLHRQLVIAYDARNGTSARRTVSPHCLVHVVGRLHMRGWDHDRNAPRDFVLSRMTNVVIRDRTEAYVGPERDTEWRQQAVLRIEVRDGENLAAVAADFGLDEWGMARRQVRLAHARYLIDQNENNSSPLFRSPVTVTLEPS